MDPVFIQTGFFRCTLERAADVALTEYRVNRTETAFQKSLGQLDGIFLGVFVTLKGMGANSGAAAFMAAAREINGRYREDLIRLRDCDLKKRAV